MAVIVSTQYIENYGVFDDSLSNIWKFKGGQTFIVWDTDERPANAVDTSRNRRGGKQTNGRTDEHGPPGSGLKGEIRVKVAIRI